MISTPRLSIRQATQAKVMDWSTHVGIALAFGLIGPFGSFDRLPVDARVAYFIASALLTILAFRATRQIIFRKLKECEFGFKERAVTIAIAAIPATLVLLGVCHFMAMPFNSPAAETPTIALTSIYAQICILGLMTIGIRRRWQMTESQIVSTAISEEPNAPECPTSMFLARHAAEFAGARLLALQAEDHYLRIHTDRGHALILMSLKDAMGELTGSGGAQVHRSYWVARDAAENSLRRGRQTLLRLANGLEVPVSRTRVAELQASDWLN